MLLPLRFRILQYIRNSEHTTLEKIYSALYSEYGSEKQFTHKNISEHLLSLYANALITIIHNTYKDIDEYRITNYRQIVLKYFL